MLIPVKAFAAAKLRLAPTLDHRERAELARSMADRVVNAAAPLPVAIVCDDDEVARWASDHGALVLAEPGRGLNGAVEAGVDRLASDGVARVIVAHADLPRAENLAWLASFDGVTLVPDRHGDGTNVLSLPTGSGFRFFYGPGSFRRHGGEARRLGLGVRIARRADLALDVDSPDDLALSR